MRALSNLGALVCAPVSMLTITIVVTTLRVFTAAANLGACPGTPACHDRSNSGVTAALALRCSPAQATERELAACLALRGGGSIWSWFEDVLRSIGLFSKEGKLLVIGMDNAGKSTLLTVLMRDEVVPHAPTHQPVHYGECHRRHILVITAGGVAIH